MELSIFDGLDINDINGQLKRINAEALQTNSFSSIVTICALLGPKHTHQISSFKSAISEITFEFAKNGILITYTEYDNDHIRVNSWSPTDAFDKILAADCHILLGPIHIGLIGGNDRSWNSVDVIANIDRLEYHVGIPNARYINCPLLRGGKYEFYHALSGTRLCAPTTCIPIFPNAHLHDATLSFVER
jgi:hypothetical protein